MDVVTDNRGDEAEAEDGVIPTFRTLQRSANLQERVQRRFQELDESRQEPEGKDHLETLIQLLKNKSDSSNKQKVKWPQDYVFVGPERKKPSYEALDECQWVLGFLRDRQAQKDQNCRENMIEYLKKIMQDAIDFGWIAAKGAHFVLMNRLTDGSETWRDVDSIHKLRQRYIQTAVRKPNVSQGKKLRDAICFRYNRGVCPRVREHEYQNMNLKHACSWCHKKYGTFENHVRKECPGFLKESKN